MPAREVGRTEPSRSGLGCHELRRLALRAPADCLGYANGVAEPAIYSTPTTSTILRRPVVQRFRLRFIDRAVAGKRAIERNARSLLPVRSADAVKERRMTRRGIGVDVGRLLVDCEPELPSKRLCEHLRIHL
jgi:hypothetical protein